MDTEQAAGPGGASGAARAAAGLALLACWALCLAPLSALAAVLTAAGVVAAAAVVQLHTGGFEADAFAVCARLAVIFAVLVMGRAWWHRTRGGEKARHPMKASLASLVAWTGVVGFAEWDGNAWLPDPLSSVLVLTCLVALIVALPLALIWAGVRVALTLYRWASGSGFVAGLITALAGLLAVGSAATCNADRPAPDWQDTTRTRTVRQVLRAAAEADGFTTKMRALLMATAEAIDAQAFQRHTSAATRAPLPQPPALPPARPDVPVLPPPDPEVTACLVELADPPGPPLEVFAEFVRRVQMNHPRLAEDELKELVVDTMLEVCLAEERAAFSSLKAVFLTKLDLRAIDRSRRDQKTCALLPDYASCQFERFDSLREPELGALHDLLCQLKPEEKAILVLRVVMGMRFRDIGEAVQLTADKAREIFNNARRRLKQKLEARCSASPWGY